MLYRLCAVPRWKCLCWAIVIALAFFAIVGVINNYYDSDTYFIITTGRYIRAEGFPDTNPFTIHAGMNMPVHQWLYDVIVSFFYDVAGSGGLLLLALILLVLLSVSLFSYIGCFTSDVTLAAAVTAVFLWWLRPWFSIRPAFLSMVIISLEQCCLFRYRDDKKKIFLVIPVLLSLLEVNLHTSLWVMYAVMVIPHIIPAYLPKKGRIGVWIRESLADRRDLMICFVLILAVGFVNPYGLKGMIYPLLSYKTVTSGISINELVSPSVFSAYGILIILSAMLLIIFLRGKKTGDIDLRDLALLSGTFFLAGMHIRNSWFLALGVIPVLLAVLRPLPEKLMGKNVIMPDDTDAAELHKQKVFRLEILLFAMILIVVCISRIDYSPTGPEDCTPQVAADYLDALDKEDIVLFTGFNNGAYMEFRGYKTYIDARPEIYSAVFNEENDIYSEYTKVYKGEIEYDEWIKKYGFTHMIVFEKCLNAYLQGCEDYRVVFSDGHNVLYEAVDFQNG